VVNRSFGRGLESAHIAKYPRDANPKCHSPVVARGSGKIVSQFIDSNRAENLKGLMRGVVVDNDGNLCEHL
jgi:hypothetical protein